MIKCQRKFVAILTALFLMVTLVMPLNVKEVYADTAETTGEKQITIFHTNDTHSRTNSFAKTKAYINGYEGANILVDAGDTFHGQSFATLEKGSSIAQILKAMNYVAMAPGNHDFNYGYERLLELGAEAGVPVLASNVTKEGNLVYGDYIIKEVNGVKVGIFGIATPETTYKTNPNNVIGLQFGDLQSIVESSKKAVSDLKAEGAEVIVALGHLGIDATSDIKSTDIAAAVEGIDVFVDGHSHSSLDKYEEFNKTHHTQVVSTGEYLNGFGQVVVNLDENNEITAINATNIDTTTLVEEDAEISALIKNIKDGQNEILGEVVGQTPIKLEGERGLVRAGHTNLGRLIASAIKDETGADIAFTNGGGIRASINAGNITMGDVITVLPFGNYIVTKYIKGQDVIDALNYSLKDMNGGFPHFAGMDVTTERYMDGDVLRWKVVDVTVNGAAIELDKDYLFATNDFMAVGGDGFTMFAKYPTENEFSALDEALINYISKVGEKGIVEVDKEVRLSEIISENLEADLTAAIAANKELQVEKLTDDMTRINVITTGEDGSKSTVRIVVAASLEEVEALISKLSGTDIEKPEEPEVPENPDGENPENPVEPEKPEENKPSGDKLPQTGAPIGADMMTVMGFVSIALGGVIVKKKKIS